MTQASMSEAASSLPLWRFRPLLVALLFLLLLYPYVENRQFFVQCLTVIVVLAAIYSVSRQRRLLLLACALGIPALLTTAVSIATANPFAAIVSKITDVLFFGFTTAVLLHHVLADREVTADTLYGAACVYLLSGLTWSLLYGLVELLHPGSFQTASGQGVTWSDLLFFSFVTLTTLGYGDITPVSSPARSLATVQAVFGVLYNAILIARLVGLYRPAAPSPQP